MIVDSSVLIALILQEPGHQKIGRVLRAEDKLHMSTATWVELGVVADRRLSEVNQHRFDAMIDGQEEEDGAIAQRSVILNEGEHLWVALQIGHGVLQVL